MDFTNFAAVEFVGAIEAQRDYERKQRKWLLQYLDLRKEADQRSRMNPGTREDLAAAA